MLKTFEWYKLTYLEIHHVYIFGILFCTAAVFCHSQWQSELSQMIIPLTSLDYCCISEILLVV